METSRSLVVVTAPGPGSGKMATCLSQLYHEYKRGVKAGYAKFETFPIWNLPLKHPVNLAYEAATADLNDVNMIDPFHLEAYGETAVNYNRDVEVFPVLNAMFEKIAGKSPYRSPTDMGVNMGGQLHHRRRGVPESRPPGDHPPVLHTALCEQRQGSADDELVYKLELVMNQAGVSLEDREVAAPARALAEEDGPARRRHPAPPTAPIVTGKTTALLGASSAALINALKALGGIHKKIHLLPALIIEPIQRLKTTHLGNRSPLLHIDEILIALAICAATNPTAELALQQLPKLRGCEAHSSVILSKVDEGTFRKPGHEPDLRPPVRDQEALS